MAVGLPAKTTYADGDVFSASDINDTNGTLNLVGQTNNFYAGKNKIINGDFGIWQRGTSFTPMSNAAYGPDRWQFGLSGDVANVSRQAFTPNDIASIGYGDAQFFMRMEVVSSNGSARTEHKIEDVRTLANQSVTVSFWAKASATTSLDVYLTQNFGSGGSTTVNLTAQVVSLTTSWQRFSTTFTVPSISGKTLGTGSFLALTFRETSASTNVTFDFWGVQVEAGLTATAFQTATGTIQGELAACQRYYFRNTGGGATAYNPYANGGTISTTGAYISFPFPVQMRVAPTAIEFSGIAVQTSGGTLAALSTLTMDQVSGFNASLAAITASTWTANQPCRMINNNNVNGYVGFTAEL